LFSVLGFEVKRHPVFGAKARACTEFVPNRKMPEAGLFKAEFRRPALP
jgi:hypothetical protein